MALGQVLHEESYPSKARKDVLIDDLLRLDFTDGGVVHEIKKSQGGEKASLYQLLYYLYYLKNVKGIATSGVIDYPQERKRVEVILTPEYERDIERILREIAETRIMPIAPAVPGPMPICKKCAYQDLCWG